MSASDPDIKQIVQNFRAQWETGSPPDLKGILSQCPGDRRSELLNELIPQDLKYRRQRGEILNAKIYQPVGNDAVEIAAAELSEMTNIQDATTQVMHDSNRHESDLPWKSAPQPPEDSEMIGFYRLLKPVGRGGMGMVYLAEQQEPIRRQVALKIIRAEKESDEIIARFEAERQALALMDHPNIARVLDAGTTPGGQPYFAMEFIEGQQITDFVKAQQLSIKQRLQLFVQTARAIEHAHKKGIIHRDIKPSNVLVAVIENEPTIKVIDFGLAKAIDNRHRLSSRTLDTSHGQLLGTLQYMSPEQADTTRLDIDTRSDVYSLGVLLYELLTGTTPIDKDQIKTLQLHDLLKSIREEEVIRPSRRLSHAQGSESSIDSAPTSQTGRRRRHLAEDLDWIAMRALEKERGRRYQSAADLADDVERYMNDDAISARPPSLTYRLRKVARKHKWAAMIISGFLILLISGILTTTSQMLRAQRAEQEAKTNEHEAVVNLEKATAATQDAIEARDESLQSLSRANFLLAVSEWKEHRTIETLLHLQQIPQEHRHLEWDLLHALADGSTATYYGHDFPILAMSVSEEVDRISTLSQDRTIRTFAAQSGKMLSRVVLDPGASVSQAAFHPLRNEIAVAFPDRRILLVDAQTGDEWNRFTGLKGTVSELAWSPDGKYLVSVDSEQQIQIWDDQAKEIRSWNAGKRPIRCLALSRNNRWLATGGNDRRICIWEFETGTLKHEIKLKQTLPRCLAFSPSGKRLAFAAENNTLVIHDHLQKKDLTRLKGHASAIVDCRYNHNGRQLVTASMDGTIKVWQVRTGDELRTCQGHLGAVDKVLFSYDGKQLISRGIDRAIKTWDLSHPFGSVLHRKAASAVIDLEFTADQTQFVTRQAKGVIDFWNFKKQRPVKSFKSARAGYSGGRGLLSHPAGKLLATLDQNAIRFKEIKSGNQVLQTRPEQPESGSAVTLAFQGRVTKNNDDTPLFDLDRHPSCMAFNHRGNRMATGYADDTRFHIWDTKSGQSIRTFPGQLDAIRSLTFSPDDQRLYTLDATSTVKIWDVDTGEELRVIAPMSGTIIGGYNIFIELDPRERYLAFAPPGETIFIWDLETDQQHASLSGHVNSVVNYAFDPSGSRMISVDGSGKIYIWDVATGAELFSFQGHASMVTSLKSVPAGDWFGTTDLSGNIAIWKQRRQSRVTVLDGHLSWVVSTAISPDGAFVASGGSDSIINVWNGITGERMLSISAYQNPSRAVGQLAINATGTRIVSEGWEVDMSQLQKENRRLILWNAQTGEAITPLAGHTGNVTCMKFSPDGSTLATSGYVDQTIHIWSAQNGTHLQTLQGEKRRIDNMAFSDNQTLQVDYEHGTRISWNLTTGEQIAATKLKSINPKPPSNYARTADQNRLVFGVDSKVILVENPELIKKDTQKQKTD